MNLSFLHATSSIMYLEHPHIYTELNKPVIFEHNISAENEQRNGVTMEWS